MKHFKAYIPILLLSFSLLLASCGQKDDASATTMRLRKTEGKVRVNDNQDKDVEAREDLGLYSGYTVKTKTESYAWVDLDSVKLAKLDEDSGIEIEKEGRDLTIRLRDGNLFFNITEPLEDDESLTIRTSTLAIGIRGTCGWVEEAGDGEQTRVYLLEGEVKCRAGKKSATVAAGEMAYVGEDGEIAVEPFDASAIPDFVLAEAEDDDDVNNMIEDLFGPDGGGNSAQGATAAILQDYLDNTLVPRLGIADLKAQELEIPPANYYDLTDYFYWTKVSGIADSRILDLDGDGADELMVTFVNEQNVGISVYEAEGNAVSETGVFLEERPSDMTGYDVTCFMAQSGGKNYLLWREAQWGVNNADFQDENLRMLQYDGESLKPALNILQTAPGSSGLEYKAYSYDEGGQLLAEEILFRDYDLEGYETTYTAEYRAARTKELFGSYGIKESDSAFQYALHGELDASTPPDGKCQVLLNLNMRGDFVQGANFDITSYLYYFSSNTNGEEAPAEMPPANEGALPLSQSIDNFVFSSGAGGWSTGLTLNPDGTFSGSYHDSEMGSTGPGYDGTIYVCNFKGKFKDIRQVDEHTYSMTLDYCNYETPEGTEWIEGRARYVAAGPYGIEGGTTFELYLPGKPVASLTEECVGWSIGLTGDYVSQFGSAPQKSTLEVYALYNVDEKNAFYQY